MFIVYQLYSLPVTKLEILSNRFWEKVIIAGPEDCWEWTASKQSSGYGAFAYKPKQCLKENYHNLSMLSCTPVIIKSA